MASLTATILPARVSPLILPEQRGGALQSIRYLLYYTDLVNTYCTASANASDTLTLTLGTTPTNWVVGSARAYVQTAFAGVTSQTLAMVVGTNAQTNAFLQSTSILTQGLIQPATGINTVNLPTSSTGSAAVTTEAVLTNAAAGTFLTYTAGTLEIVLSLLNLDAFY